MQLAKGHGGAGEGDGADEGAQEGGRHVHAIQVGGVCGKGPSAACWVEKGEDGRRRVREPSVLGVRVCSAGWRCTQALLPAWMTSPLPQVRHAPAPPAAM